MNNNREIGKKAEEIAVEYLKNKGFEILETNWYHLHKEIDIIARITLTGRKYPVLVVVEVKSRTHRHTNIEMPYQSVDRQKQKFIISATNSYILKKKLNCEVRYDIVSIVNFPDKVEIQHIEDAFYPIVR